MADTAGEDQAGPGATLVANGHTNDSNEAVEDLQGGNKFQQAVAAWRSLDLTKLVSSLDTAASDLVTSQKDSLVQRKDLAQKTKDFRKLDDAGKLGEIKDLLKNYQSYIDALTNQSKGVQAAFMQAYSPLSEAPDPYPLLEASIDSLITADEVVPRLEQENEHLQKQVAKLNGQLEESEKQLEQERKQRQSFEASQDDKIKEIEDSWSAVTKEKEDNWKVREGSLEEKVESQDRLLKELKATYEVSQRLEVAGEETHGSSRGAASQAELDIANSELERASVRLAELESRNEQLRVELAQSTSQAHSSGRNTAIEDDPAFLRLQSENQSLLRKLESTRYDKDAEKSSVDSKLRNLDREIGALRADREALEIKVQKWSDYDEISRELDMLRTIEFSTVDDDDADAGGDDLQSISKAPTDGRKGSESLEHLLLARNRRLSTDVTELRVSHNEMQRRLETLQEDLSETNMDLEKTRNLNATLENDLQKTQQEASNAFETMSVAGTYTSRFPRSSYGGSRRGTAIGGTSPTSSIIGGFDPSARQASMLGSFDASSRHGSVSPGRGTLEALRSGEPVGGGSGILPMVTAQRDRFKKKITELEQELQKQYQAVAALRSEVASLQKDNLKLYEKTRYVSTYSRSSAQPTTSTSGASYGASPNASTLPMPNGGGTEPLDRYRSAYEQNISPFAAFRGRESARAVKRMSLPERAVFQITRMVLATRTSRNLFALYCVGLHLLVLVTLYWLGTVDIEKHGSNLAVAGAAGAAGAAAAAGGGGGTGLTGVEGSEGHWHQEGFQPG